MWKQKMCLGTSGQYEISEKEQISLFHDVGFDGFFCMYEMGKDLVILREYADSLGMIFQSVHAPFVHMDSIWGKDTKAAEAALYELICCVEETARAKVSLIVMHAFIGFNDHTPTKEGIERLQKVVDAAERHQIKLAFENTEGEEYLAAVMEAFKDRKHVGFCIDTGHEMCYNHSQNMLALYGDRLLCTHINDNLGIRDINGEITFLDDLHLLPFDGVADWEQVAKRLNACGYYGELTFELNNKSKPYRHDNDIYAEQPLLNYLVEAYKRACRFATLKMKLSENCER